MGRWAGPGGRPTPRRATAPGPPEPGPAPRRRPARLSLGPRPAAPGPPEPGPAPRRRPARLTPGPRPGGAPPRLTPGPRAAAGLAGTPGRCGSCPFHDLGPKPTDMVGFSPGS